VQIDCIPPLAVVIVPTDTNVFIDSCAGIFLAWPLFAPTSTPASGGRYRSAEGEHGQSHSSFPLLLCAGQQPKIVTARIVSIAAESGRPGRRSLVVGYRLAGAAVTALDLNWRENEIGLFWKFTDIA